MFTYTAHHCPSKTTSVFTTLAFNVKQFMDRKLKFTFLIKIRFQCLVSLMLSSQTRDEVSFINSIVIITLILVVNLINITKIIIDCS